MFGLIMVGEAVADGAVVVGPLADLLPALRADAYQAAADDLDRDIRRRLLRIHLRSRIKGAVLPVREVVEVVRGAPAYAEHRTAMPSAPENKMKAGRRRRTLGEDVTATLPQPLPEGGCGIRGVAGSGHEVALDVRQGKRGVPDHLFELRRVAKSVVSRVIQASV